MSAKAYPYYPGCSLQHHTHAYQASTEEVVRALDITLQEMDDWNCCGATEYFTVNRLPAYALVARNLARAQAAGAEQIVAPCSLCFLNLHKTDKNMNRFPALGAKVNRALAAGELHYEPGSVEVRHLLEVLLTDVGLDTLKTRARRPLYGVTLAPYYGCLLARPDSVFESTEQPTAMDDMIQALGAQVAPFSLKTFCCGGHMTQISDTTAYEMIHKIIKNAADGGADAIVTACPMCQLNLDAYQGQANAYFGTDYHMPVLYFTQVIGLALGLSPQRLGFGQEFVDAQPVVAKIQDTPLPRTKPERRSKKALPMPVMSNGRSS